MKVEFLNRNDGHGMIMRIYRDDFIKYVDDDEFANLIYSLNIFYKAEFPFERNDCENILKIMSNTLGTREKCYVYFTHNLDAEIYIYNETTDTYHIFSPNMYKGKTGKGEIPEWTKS